MKRYGSPTAFGLALLLIAMPSLVAAEDLPDLVPTELTCPDTVGAGLNVTVSQAITNQGTAPVDGFIWKYYWSTDQVPEDDEWAGTLAASNTLNPGSSRIETTTVKATLEPGTYYLILWVDPSGAVIETDDGNNTIAYGPITVTAADLVPTELIAPDTVGAGLIAPFTYSIENQGTGVAGRNLYGYGWNFHWSLDPVLSGDDLYGGARGYGFEHSPGKTLTFTTELQVPLEPATYYLILDVDPQDGIPEDNDENNTIVSGPIVITPADLVPIALTGPETVGAAIYAPYSYSIANQGTGAAGRRLDGYDWYFYWSLDPVLDENDLFGGVSGYNNFPHNPGAILNFTTELPAPLEPETYYLILDVDVGNDITEADENNNTIVFGPIVVTPPDLVPVELSGPNTIDTGAEASFSYAIANQGTGVAGRRLDGYNWNFYWSSDAVLDENDLFTYRTGYNNFPHNPGGVRHFTATLKAPNEEAVYYLILDVDPENKITEADEENNTLAFGPISVGDAPPVADAGADQTVIVNLPVSLDGSGSSDLDGDPLTYQWTEGSNPEVNILTGADSDHPQFTPRTPGLYEFVLVVNDGYIESAPDSVLVTVISQADAISNLIDKVGRFNLQQGIDNSLDAKLDAARQALDDLSEGNDVAATNALNAFINTVEAQRGLNLTDAQADELIADAQTIVNSLSA